MMERLQDATSVTSARVKDLRVFPVCHHSPRSAKVLVDYLLEVRPSHILIEGPSDATPFIEQLLDPGNVPPLALLAFRHGERGLTFSWPFVEFSPEYQALKVGQQLMAQLAFCDVPAGWRSPAPPASPAAPAPASIPRPDPGHDLPRYRGVGEFWEKEMETRSQSIQDYLEVALELGRRHHLDDPWTRLREAHMLAAVHRLVAEGADPGSIVVVCGAAHASALLEGDVDLGRLKSHEDGGVADIYLVPTSYRQISAVHGYAAGLTYPGYGQLLWEHREKPEQIVESALTRISRDLAAGGHTVSIADVLDGVVLARNLAAMRRRHAPGVEEIVQAVETCVTRGAYEKAGPLVEEMMVGDRVGTIVGRLRSPVSREFFDFVNDPRHCPPLSLVDRTVKAGLDRSVPLDRQISVFLHRLALAGIPFAQLAGDRRSAIEEWTLRWTESVEIALLGCADSACSLEDAATIRASTELEYERFAEGLAQLALKCARSDLDEILGKSLTKLAALLEGAILPSDAVKAMAFLTAVEGDGTPTGGARALVGPLLQKLLRTVIDRVSAPGRIPEEEAATRIEVLEGLAQLWGLLGPGGDATLESALRRMRRDPDQHARVAGAAAGLMVQLGAMSVEELVIELWQRFEAAGEEKGAGAFLRGVLRPTGEELLLRDDFVAGSRSFILSLDEGVFLRVLPVLRLAFSELVPATRALFLKSLLLPVAREGPGTYRAPDPEWMSCLDQKLRIELASCGLDLPEVGR